MCARRFDAQGALGSTDRITDASEVEQVTYRYRAFGEQTAVFQCRGRRH